MSRNEAVVDASYPPVEHNEGVDKLGRDSKAQKKTPASGRDKSGILHSSHKQRGINGIRMMMNVDSIRRGRTNRRRSSLDNRPDDTDRHFAKRQNS